MGVGFKQCSPVLLLLVLHPVAIHSEGTRVIQLPDIVVLVQAWAECLHSNKH